MARAGLCLLAVTIVGSGAALARPALRHFADRPVTWSEHDDENINTRPTTNHLDDLDLTLSIRDSVANEAERILSLEGGMPARDVNAADEVPCSTWYCPRNHLYPMTPEAVAAGPDAPPPVLPLRVTKGKNEGAAIGFQVMDARGHKFLLKFDPPGHLGLVTAAEAVGNRLFHAAGYNVPGAHVVEFGPEDLRIDPKATFELFRVEKRTFGPERVREKLASVARLPGGRLRAVAIPWIGGQIIGPSDMIGRRDGDPNDRIPHEHRRSLRASWVLDAWLSILDPGPINTLDSIVDPGGRHFVRHYLIDFSCAFGSVTDYTQGPQQDGEYTIEIGRTLLTLLSFGLYQRPFQSQEQRDTWGRLDRELPAIGYFPAEGFDPDTYRTNRKVPPHMRLTDADAYWGAKLVTAFSDAQLRAVIATTRLAPPDAAYLEHALTFRRDVIGRRYLRAVAAVENPTVADDGSRLCFDDLAIARGFVRPDEARYVVTVEDGNSATLAAFEQAAVGARACVPLGGASGGYRVVSVRERLAGGAGRPDELIGKAAHVHLVWRAAEHKFVVVGLERDQ